MFPPLPPVSRSFVRYVRSEIGAARIVLYFAGDLSSVNLQTFLEALQAYVTTTYGISRARQTVYSVESVTFATAAGGSARGIRLSDTTSSVGFKVTIDIPRVQPPSFSQFPALSLSEFVHLFRCRTALRGTTARVRL